MTKSDRDIMEILIAYDPTKTVWSAAQLAGCDPKTVERYVALREAGRNPYERARRPRRIDPYLPKIEEWIEASAGKAHSGHRVVPRGPHLHVPGHRVVVAPGQLGRRAVTAREVAVSGEVAGHQRGRKWPPTGNMSWPLSARPPRPRKPHCQGDEHDADREDGGRGGSHAG